MSKEKCLCDQCNISKDSVSRRENGLVICDICEEKRLRALRLEKRHKLNDNEHAVPEDVSEMKEAPAVENDPPSDQETGMRPLHAASTMDGGAMAERASDISDEHHCTAQCPYRENAVNLEMVRCCLCSKWYHLVCVALPPEEMGVWPCPECRHLARDVRQTKDVLHTLMEHMNTIMDTQKNQCEVLNLEKSQLLNELSRLENENETLRARNAELEHQLQNVTSAPSINSTTLVIGSSLIRYIDENKLKDTEVRCMSGAKFRDIAAELVALADSDNRYARIVILAGGNDAAAPTEHINLEDTVESARAAISAAKRMSDEVAVSEIPPRFSPPHANDNKSALNANMLTLAEELSVSFLPNRSHYFLQSDEINDGYYYDDVHLTLKGSEKLAKSMNLIGRSGMDSCSLKPSQTAPMTRPNPRPRHRRRTGKQPARGPTPDLMARREQLPTAATRATPQNRRTIKPTNSRGSGRNHSYQKHTMNTVARTGNPDTPDDFNSAEFWRKARDKTSNQRTYPSRTTHYTQPNPTNLNNETDYCKKMWRAKSWHFKLLPQKRYGLP